MAEVAEVPPAADTKVLSVRHFEVQPPENLVKDLAPPDGTYATTKEEEWVTKKKKELTTTRQIETRVQRQVVLEDGKVVEDSGPLVTSNTTEDTETQESEQTEHRTTGEAPPVTEGEEGWVATTNSDGTVREVRQQTVKSREQTDERLETEQVQHCGDFSDEAFQAAVKASLLDLRAALRSPELNALTPVNPEPKIVHQSTRTKKVVDTEDSVETSQVQPDGRVVTETRRTTEHEEVAEHSEPDDDADADGDADTTRAVTGDEEHETLREASHRFAKTKDQEFVEYLADGVKVGEEMRYQAETAEGERRGDADLGEHEWDSLSTRIRRMRRGAGRSPRAGGPADVPAAAAAADRKDALTKKPLDFEEEEVTRKVETSKWLEHHFGSDSRSSKGSLDDDSDMPPATGNTSFINVTMKSRPIVTKVTTSSPPLVNGAAATGTTIVQPKFVSMVNSSSRVFVSSPEPDDPSPLPPPPPAQPPPPANGYFQGVSEWSERNHSTSTRELKSTTHRPERVQVLPTGPNHTFTSKPLGYSEKTTVYKTSSGNSRSSPYPGSSLANPDRSLSYINGSPGRTSPYGNGRASPAPQPFHAREASPSPYANGHRSHSPFAHREQREHREHREHRERREYKDYQRDHSPYNGRHSPYLQQVRSPSPYDGRASPAVFRRDASPSPLTARDAPAGSKVPARAHTRTPGGSSLDEDGLQPPARRQRSPTRLRFSDREEREGEDSLDGYRGDRGDRTGGGYRWEQRGRSRDEPRPDYSPDHGSPSPSPEHAEGGGKRLYRRPRIDVDLPPAAAAASPPPAAAEPKKHGGIGESFRRLVGKFRASSAERKRRKAAAQAAAAANRRSPSPRRRGGRRGSADDDLEEEDVVDGEGERNGGGGGGSSGGPVAPPRSHRQHKDQQRPSRATQTQAGQTHLNGHAGSSHSASSSMQAQQRRFYLGEDPFGGSIYGREREYDGVKPVRRHRNGHRRSSREEDDMNRANVSVTTSSSLGRLSKSTSRLAGGGGRASPLHDTRPVVDYTRAAQTLPRKLYDEHAQTSRLKRQVYQQQQLQRNGIHSSSANKAHSNSMINVSIINNVTPPPSGNFTKLTNGISSAPGPAKPARTYRTNLSRSKSFNVHTLGDTVETPSFLPKTDRESSGLYKSTSHLHRLDESPPPLKSPSILASISRSQRDLSGTDSFDKEDTFVNRQKREETKFSRSTSNLLNNGYTSPPPTTTTSTHDAKKRLFMRELMERAPELYRTLKNNSDDEAELRAKSPVTSPTGGRLYSSTPLKNGTSGVVNGSSSHRILDYSNSFRSSSTAGTPPERGFRPSLVNGTVDRVTSPVGSKSSFGSGNGGPMARRGSSSNDDYSETVRITSKSDDPLRPSVTNTVQSFSKKTVPTKSGLSTETIESKETTTVTKSRYSPGVRYLENGHGKYSSSIRNGSPALNGSVVIEVRPSRK